jgi:hypothetical protein
MTVWYGSPVLLSVLPQGAHDCAGVAQPAVPERESAQAAWPGWQLHVQGAGAAQAVQMVSCPGRAHSGGWGTLISLIEACYSRLC